MDIFQVNTVMTDIPNDAVTPQHRAILRIMGYDLHEQNEPAGTVFISSGEPVSDLETAMDLAEGDQDEDLISCSSLGIDAKAGERVGICEVLQSILKEPAANGLECIDIQGAHYSLRPVREYTGRRAARIERDRIRVFDSMTAFDKQSDQPMPAENTAVHPASYTSESANEAWLTKYLEWCVTNDPTRAEDASKIMVRYGLLPPQAFVAEMRERVQMDIAEYEGSEVADNATPEQMLEAVMWLAKECGARSL